MIVIAVFTWAASSTDPDSKTTPTVQATAKPVDNDPGYRAKLRLHNAASVLEMIRGLLEADYLEIDDMTDFEMKMKSYQVFLDALKVEKEAQHKFDLKPQT